MSHWHIAQQPKTGRLCSVSWSRWVSNHDIPASLLQTRSPTSTRESYARAQDRVEPAGLLPSTIHCPNTILTPSSQHRLTTAGPRRAGWAATMRGCRRGGGPYSRRARAGRPRSSPACKCARHHEGWGQGRRTAVLLVMPIYRAAASKVWLTTLRMTSWPGAHDAAASGKSTTEHTWRSKRQALTLSKRHAQVLPCAV